MKQLIIPALVLGLSGCAIITNDSKSPIAVSFSDGSSGHCVFENKHGSWDEMIPTTTQARPSDGPVNYRCTTLDGRETSGSIANPPVTRTILLDFGLVEALTDKQPEPPANYVIPVAGAK